MNTLVTGLQPTGLGELHIGNYLGVIHGLPTLIKNHEQSFVFAADIHATTVNYNPKTLRQASLSLVKALYASGVPEESLFIQSSISEHFEIGMIIQHLTTIGQLENMTQYKQKAKQNEERNDDNQTPIPTGLLTYPALMAGDILLYRANVVPAGDDQTQHVQYVRDIVDTFKKSFKSNFLIKPDIAKLHATRVMQLNDPSKKMSKSADNQSGTVYITENMDIVSKKYNRAVSGSNLEILENYDDNESGTQNLLNILGGFKNMDKKEIALEMAGKNMSSLKKSVIEAHDRVLSPIRERIESISNDDMQDILTKNFPAVKLVAQENMRIIRKIVGFA